jgi:hypothetical protein
MRRLVQPTAFTRASITYEADFANMLQKRTDGRYDTERSIRRVQVEDVTRHPVPLPTWNEQSVHELIAPQPLVWTTQPTAVKVPAITAACTDVTATTATITTSGTIVHRYELHGGAALNTDVTLDNLMYSTAAELYRRQPHGGYSTVQRVEVYSSPVTKARYEAKRQQFAAQGISTTETWVIHGTNNTDNVHSIMTEGFKVRKATSSKLSALHRISSCLTLHISLLRPGTTSCGCIDQQAPVVSCHMRSA